MIYRAIFAETGNCQGNEQLLSCQTPLGARRKFMEIVREYKGDCWGRIEVFDGSMGESGEWILVARYDSMLNKLSTI